MDIKTPAERAAPVSAPPLVPPGLRELLDLLARLAERLPYPADVTCYDRREDLQQHRAVILDVQIGALADQLRICDQYPSVAAKLLAEHCQLSAEAIRKVLAEPLGYEPKAATERTAARAPEVPGEQAGGAR